MNLVALILWLAFVGVEAGFAGVRNYITWDDMKVEEEELKRKISLDLRDYVVVDDQSRVIVVDQNGKGDSLTVQGAVDMVPLNNSHRVKIYILPGIYR